MKTSDEKILELAGKVAHAQNALKELQGLFVVESKRFETFEHGTKQLIDDTLTDLTR